MTTVLLVNDTSDQNNWGCLATTFALKKLLADNVIDLSLEVITLNQLRKRFRVTKLPRSRGRIFEYDSGNPHKPFRGNKLSQYVSRVLSEAIEFFPSVSDEFDSVATAWLNGNGGPVGNDAIEKIKNADVVIFNGEGSLYENALKGQRPLFLMYLAKKYFDKPCFIVNHSAHFKSSTPVLLSMARTVYPLMERILVREPYSQRNLKELVHIDAEVVPDALFSLTFDDNTPLPFLDRLQGEKYICIGATSLAGTTKWQPIDAYSTLVEEFQALGFKVVLVAKDKPDMFLSSVAQSTGGALFFGPSHSFADLYKLLSKSRLFVSGRYHPSIIAAMAGCPLLALSANMHKMEGLYELFDYPIRQTFDYFRLSSLVEDIVQSGKTLMGTYEEISTNLKQFSATYAKSSQRNITIINDYLG